METRQNLITIAVGVQGVGKTYQAIESIKRYVKANPGTGKKAGKVLIFDVNMEYEEYPTLAIKDIRKYSLSENSEVRRILPIKEDGNIMDTDDMEETLGIILKKFRRGLIVLDDFNSYLVSTASVKIISALCTVRHKGVDLLLNLQSLSAVTPRMFSNAKFIRFHYIIDSVERIKDRVPNYTLYRITQLLVNQQYNNNNEIFYAYIVCLKHKVIGEFNKTDFQKAAMEYLLEDRAMVRNAMLRFNGKDSHNQALDYCCKDLFKYYGNAK